jgi:hypothetical protein
MTNTKFMTKEGTKVQSHFISDQKKKGGWRGFKGSYASH